MLLHNIRFKYNTQWFFHVLFKLNYFMNYNNRTQFSVRFLICHFFKNCNVFIEKKSLLKNTEQSQDITSVRANLVIASSVKYRS